ncbi:hypothetical protein BD410DRAFT_817234 [Rickenella mellea]|uniref:DUF6606 domain-containing protein n=1 Tax=Rickenella mellea TaxID=50990 RepID=A0A4Y7PFH6_9AGAM|nr:hypothetical protein BD410DRAFT_817234 [Rickenella mellea]
MLLDSSRRYCQCVPEGERPRWDTICRTLEDLCAFQEDTVLYKSTLKRSMRNMRRGGILALHIHAQNAGVIMRRSNDEVTIECFEASPMATKVNGTQGKLLCNYPASTVSVPLETFQDETFRDQFATFLTQMDVDVIDKGEPLTMKGRSKVVETRDTANPRFITELLVGILRGIGRPVEPTRIQKRIGDEALTDNGKLPWRRASLSNKDYKSFIAFALSDILESALHSDLDSDLLFGIRAKASRRLFKTGNSTPYFVQERVADVISATLSKVIGLVHATQTPLLLWWILKRRFEPGSVNGFSIT